MHSPHVRNNELVALGRQSLHLREKHFAVISRSLGSAFAVQIDDLVENDWWRLTCQSVSTLNRLGERRLVLTIVWLCIVVSQFVHFCTTIEYPFRSRNVYCILLRNTCYHATVGQEIGLYPRVIFQFLE